MCGSIPPGLSRPALKLGASFDYRATNITARLAEQGDELAAMFGGTPAAVVARRNMQIEQRRVRGRDTCCDGRHGSRHDRDVLAGATADATAETTTDATADATRRRPPLPLWSCACSRLLCPLTHLHAQGSTTSMMHGRHPSRPAPCCRCT